MSRTLSAKERVRGAAGLVLLAAAALTFVTGLVLFFGFHVGGGHLRGAVLGLPRLVWLNLHRLPALVVAVSLGLHLALNARAFLARLRRGLVGKLGAGNGAELALYLAFLTVVLTGLAAWFLLGGSPALEGPVRLGRPPQLRHRFLDIHNIVGLAAFAAAVHHVGHRWRRLVRGPRTK